MIEVRGPDDAEFGSRRFVESIRSDPRYRRARIVGMVENTGDNNYPQYWDRWWKSYPPYISAVNQAHPQHLPGVPTGEKEKILYDEVLNEHLSRGTIAFEQQFITGLSGTRRRDEHAAHVLNEMKDQLRSYCIITKKSEQKGVPTVTRTRSGKHSGGQDDMAMAIQIAVYWSAKCMQRDQEIRESPLKGFPFYWSIDEEHERRIRERELEAKIPTEVLLQMPVKEKASATEQRRLAKRRRLAVADASTAAAAAAAASAAAPASASAGPPGPPPPTLPIVMQALPSESMSD